MHTIWNRTALVLRVCLGAIATAITLWAFLHVTTRPWRQTALRGDQVQLRLVHWGDDTENAIVAGLINAFHQAHPDIRVQRINPGSAAAVTQKVQTMVAAGDPPDVFYLSYDRVAGWASKGLLEPLEPYMQRDRGRGDPDAVTLDDFYANVLACFRYDPETDVTGRGVLYGMPKDFTTVGFYYNKDLFRRAGLPDPPAEGWTWDEFVAACRRISELPGCFGADFATWEAMLRIYCWSQGAFLTTDGFQTYDFTDPAVVAALEQLKDWFDDGRTLASAKTQIETGEDPFLSGRVGLAGPFGRWKVPVYRLIDDFDWDFAPLPHAAGEAPVNGIFTTAWAMSSDSDRKEAAWKLIRFLSGEPGQRMISETGLAIPAMISVAESDAFMDPLKPHNDAVYLRAVENARPIVWPGENRYLDAFRIRMEEVFKSGAKTVPEALAEIQQTWQRFDHQSVLDRDYPPMRWGLVAAWIGIPSVAVCVLGGTAWWLRRPRRGAAREELTGLGMISPWVIGFAAFTAFPILLSLLLSFSRWSGVETLDRADFLGLDNYRQLLSDGRFMTSLRVTAIYVLLAVPLGQAAALVAALLMNSDVRGMRFFRAAWYLPSVLAGVAISILWARVFHHEHGLLNALLNPLLNPLGFSAPRWFERDVDVWGVPAFVIMSLWSIGGPMMIYLAGLKGIPGDLYEAAEIDGARGLTRFRNVTLPMLSPVIFFNGIIAIIASFQVFTQAYVMTGGGPGDATRFYVVYLYNQAFDLHDMGYASALAWLLLLLVLALTLLVMAGSRRFVYYEALR